LRNADSLPPITRRPRGLHEFVFGCGCDREACAASSPLLRISFQPASVRTDRTEAKSEDWKTPGRLIDEADRTPARQTTVTGQHEKRSEGTRKIFLRSRLETERKVII
jgi:hypothetical protein